MRPMLKGVFGVATVLAALSWGGAPTTTAAPDDSRDKSDDIASFAERRSAESERDQLVVQDGNLAAQTAVADSLSGQDTTGDTSPIYDCHSDITTHAGSYALDEIALWFSTICGSNPSSGVNWTVGISHVIWAIDVNGDSIEDYEIFYGYDGGVIAEVRRVSDFALMCYATPGWDGNATFGAWFSPSCIGNPAGFRLQTYMVWDETPYSTTCACPYDVVPNFFGWSGTISRPPPPIGTGPGATSASPGQLDVFVRGNDDGLYTRHFNGSAWSAYQNLGGIVVSTPAAASRNPGQIEVFIRGNDNALWTRSYLNGSWGPWYSLGGILSSAPAAVSRSANTLDVFVAGYDRALYTMHYNGSSWSSWANLGGVLTAAPAVAATGNGAMTAFVRGQDDALWTMGYSGSGWSGWSSLGGVLSSPPGAASRGTGTVDVFIRGSDLAIWTMRYAGGWSGWSSLGGSFTSGPAAASMAPGVLDVFVRGGDNALWSTRNGGGGWVAWYSLGGIIK